MVSVLYEHPLNERIRNYLKLEQLFMHAKNCHIEEIKNNYQVFFNALFSILDTLDRNDIRGELIKDLERLEHLLVAWSKSPEINSAALDDSLQQVISFICVLRGNVMPWNVLRNDKLLASIKQRFAIQGGSSTFDLPQLQFWINQQNSVIHSHITSWLDSLSTLANAINMVLKFLRQKSEFSPIETDSGFYQDNGEGLMLLRIKLPSEANYFPTVSGNKFRYSIRFMVPCEQSGSKYSNQATKFELAKC